MIFINKIIMKKIINWLTGLLKDETGSPSSKRFVGIMCAIFLCITMYHNSFSTVDTAPSSDLVNAVALLAFGCLGLSSIDKFTKAKRDTAEATTKPE